MTATFIQSYKGFEIFDNATRFSANGYCVNFYGKCLEDVKKQIDDYAKEEEYYQEY